NRSITSKRSDATQPSMITDDGIRGSVEVRIESRPLSGGWPRAYRGARLVRTDPMDELMDGGRAGPKAKIRNEPDAPIFDQKSLSCMVLTRVFTSKPSSRAAGSLPTTDAVVGAVEDLAKGWVRCLRGDPEGPGQPPRNADEITARVPGG